MLVSLKAHFERGDLDSKILKGYIHQLNMDTFGMYMFSERGIYKLIKILVYTYIF